MTSGPMVPVEFELQCTTHDGAQGYVLHRLRMDDVIKRTTSLTNFMELYFLEGGVPELFL